MLFKSTAAAKLLALASSSAASTITTQLYAYGAGTNGAPVIYVDGLAYIGQNTPTFDSTTVANITFITDSDDTTVPWTIVSNTTAVTFNETLSMYIVPTGGVFEQIGFVSSADDLPADAVETGFAWFGTQVAYAANESDYELMFWANGTDDEAIWSLVWSSPDTDKPNGSFPVTLKSTPPTVVST